MIEPDEITDSGLTFTECNNFKEYKHKYTGQLDETERLTGISERFEQNIAKYINGQNNKKRIFSTKKITLIIQYE